MRWEASDSSSVGSGDFLSSVLLKHIRSGLGVMSSGDRMLVRSKLVYSDIFCGTLVCAVPVCVGVSGRILRQW